MNKIKKSPVTTALAVLVVFACLFLVYIERCTMTEVSGFLVIAGALLFSDDKKFADNFFPTKKKGDDDQEETP